MEVGAEVWVRDAGPETWVAGVVTKKTPAADKAAGDGGGVVNELEIELETGGTASFRVAPGETEMADLKLRNEDDFGMVADLITLPHLHEPALLHSLSRRFAEGAIYTFTGPILIAVNPFKRLPLYTEDTLLTYFEQGLLGAQGLKTAGPLPPHVYAIADAAYRAMMESIRSSSSSSQAQHGSQSILISGESGAGKTESTKHVMKYLTTVGAPNPSTTAHGSGSSKGSVGGGQDASETVMARVLQSNPVLEAFGNARTIRNDNSSRFGKFIELHFDKRGHLLGASVETYLLEKVRLPHQAPDERNFHIFYQLCAGATDAQREAWRLGSVEEYALVSQGGCFTLRDVDDRDEFAATLTAMRVLGFPEEAIDALLRLVAGLLHLGQLAFTADDSGEGSQLAPSPHVASALEAAAGLLQVSPSYLAEVLTTRVMETRGEAFTVKLRPNQAQDARDALGKALYGRMFCHLVERINACIACFDLKDSRASISVLDIFGFECFQTNSFEQLCINYTNETLQQQFNRFVFKMEQAEYEREAIQWSFISFPDNADCLDLIEGRPQGILAMLDDECKINGSDTKLAGRLQKELGQHPRFYVSKKMQAENKFGIRHYAGEVAYDTQGFLEKNKDTLPKEATSLFLSSESAFVRALFEQEPAVPTAAAARAGGGAIGTPIRTRPRGSNGALGLTSPAAGPSTPSFKSPPPSTSSPFISTPGGSVLAAASVGMQFKQQLLALMVKIHQTRPHYIRCLKPNDDNAPDALDRSRLTEQLRYGGVLEAVRVARSGYPVRLPHSEFYARYRCLATAPGPVSSSPEPPSSPPPSPKKGPAQAGGFPYHIDGLAAEPSRAWCGRVLDAVLALQEREAEAAAAAAANQDGQRMLERASVQLGKTKVFLRKNAYEILEHRRTARLAAAAVKLQAFLRGASLRREFVVLKAASLRLQRVVRGMQARKRVAALRKERAAVRVQTAWRAHHAARRYQRFRSAVLRLQSRYRGRAARHEVFVLRTEQKALLLQAWVRMALARARYHAFLRSVVSLQCGYRRRVAKRQLRELRAAAREIGTLQRNNEKLKEELAELRENIQRKAEQARMEKERELEAERARAAAAALVELEEWKRKCGLLEQAYAEETALRVEAEAQAARTEEAAVAQSKKWREAAEAAAAAKEDKKRVERERQRLQQDLQQECRRRQQAEEQLQQALLLSNGPLSASAAVESRAASGGAASPPLLGHTAHHRARGNSADAGGRKVQGPHPQPHHRLIDAIGQRIVDNKGAAAAGAGAGASSPPRHEETGEDSQSFLLVSSSLVPTTTAASIPESNPVVAKTEAEHEAAAGAEAAEAKAGEEEEEGAAPAPPSDIPAAALTRRPSSARMTRRQVSSTLATAPFSSSSSSLANAALVAAAAAVAASASAAAEREDEMDRSVNLADQDQVLAPKGDTLGRRKEEVDRLALRCRTHRAVLREVVQVEVLEILPPSLSSSSASSPPRHASSATAEDAPSLPPPQQQLQPRKPQFLPVRMQVDGLSPSPPPANEAGAANDDLLRARLVWEEEKPKRSLLNTLGWGSSSASSASKSNKPPVPEPVHLSDLYAVVRGVRRVRPREEVLVAAGGDQSRLLTLTTQALPDKARRGLVLRFPRREDRNHFLDALRTCLGELLQLDDPDGQAAEEAAAALQRRAQTLKGHEEEGPHFVALPEAKALLVQERRGQWQALGLALETAMDAGGLEDENRELCRAASLLQAALTSKDEALAKAHEDLKERITLLRRVQDLEMENADLHTMMQKFDQANAAQHQMEVEHKQKQLDAQLQVNQALMDKNVGVQKENCELKEECERLAELLHTKEQELAQVLLKLTHLPRLSSPSGSPVSLTGLASSAASESPGDMAADGSSPAATTAAHGASVLFSLPGRR